MLLFFPELGRNMSAWCLDAAGAGIVQALIHWQHRFRKQSWATLTYAHTKREQTISRQLGWWVIFSHLGITLFICICLGPVGTNPSNASKFLSLLACEPSIAEHDGKILECVTFYYKIFSPGQTNSGVTFIFKARTLSQNTDLRFLMANTLLS